MAKRAKILGTGHYVPPHVVTNQDLEKRMDTTDEWIQQRTGIQERRWVEGEVGATDLAVIASEEAIRAAGLEAKDIDAIIFATLSPDLNFPGSGCLLNDRLGINGVPSLDIRNQCSAFPYGLEIADAFIRAGVYRHVLLVGSEVHSTGLDVSTAGRDVAVIFGDGAGAVVLGPSDVESEGVLTTIVGADGRFARELWTELPGSRCQPRISVQGIEEGRHFPKMNGREVFKHASRKMPELVREALNRCDLTTKDIDLLIPHQANLRISEMVQRALDLPDDRVFNNIMRYGNTTAASIPIALDECVRNGRLKAGDLLAVTAFGAGFTWGAALIRF
ncbi:MAG: ketoacyl-ACP synthase III [Deltaproteobacteria bacterium]|nr:ketoacyl-ACP synthase III [Deltaproteobacteria bacterium]